MRPRTVLPIYIWGIGLTTAAIGVLAAVLQSRWVMLPLVFAGSLGIVMCSFWRWRTGPFRQNMRRALHQSNYLATNIIVLAAAVAWQIAVSFMVVLSTQSAVEDPCLCADRVRLAGWWDLTVGGFTLTALEAAGLLGLVLFLDQLFYRGE